MEYFHMGYFQMKKIPYLSSYVIVSLTSKDGYDGFSTSYSS